MSFKQVTRSVWHNPGNRGQRVRKTWDAVRWQAHKRVVGTPSTIRLANGVWFRAYPDCVISSALIYADWPEYHELQFVRRRLQPGALVIDVGANVGHLSLLLADRVGSENLFAVEPTPVTFARLVENWRLNGWPTDRLRQAAVGAEAGTVRVADVSRPVTTNSVLPSDSAEGVEVPLVRLDDLRDEWAGRTIGFLKIDVEGFETHVFRGARRMLDEDRPRLIMFESLSDRIADEIHDLLTAAGYTSFELDVSGRPDLAHQAAQNQFAVPSETVAELLA